MYRVLSDWSYFRGFRLWATSQWSVIVIDKLLFNLVSAMRTKKVLIAQTAPATRIAIAEEFGAQPGTISTGKLVGGLKAAGFDFVFDTNFGADLTIMEEAHELLQRLEAGGPLPLMTSCCPAWINLGSHSQFIMVLGDVLCISGKEVPRPSPLHLDVQVTARNDGSHHPDILG